MCLWYAEQLHILQLSHHPDMIYRGVGRREARRISVER
jgi:hypothetical protein